MCHDVSNTEPCGMLPLPAWGCWLVSQSAFSMLRAVFSVHWFAAQEVVVMSLKT